MSAQPHDAPEVDTFSLEREKLAIEKLKARWNAIAVLVPIMAAILTVAFGLWSTHQQAKFEFELKAAEIVMNSNSPDEQLGRARAFVAMFPDLKERFGEAFDPDEFTNRELGVPEAKKEFLRLLADKGLTKEEIVAIWKHLFPGDGWIKGFSLDQMEKEEPDVGHS